MKKIFVKDVRNKITKPLTVFENDKIELIANKFLSSPINRTIYVVDKNSKFLGYITVKNFLKIILLDMVDYSVYKDISQEAYIYGKLGNISIAKDIMIDEEIFVYDNDNLEKVISLMHNYSLQELPVIDKDRILIGDLNIHEIIYGWKIRRKS